MDAAEEEGGSIGGEAVGVLRCFASFVCVATELFAGIEEAGVWWGASVCRSMHLK